MKAPLEVGPVEPEPALEPEHSPVVAPRRKRLQPTALGADVSVGRGSPAAPALRPVSLALHLRNQLLKTPTGPRRRPGQITVRSTSSQAGMPLPRPRVRFLGREGRAAAAARLRIGIDE